MKQQLIKSAPAPEPASALAKISAELDQTVARATGLVAASTHSLAEALRVGETLDQLRRLLDMPEVKTRVLALKDNALGFLTDSERRKGQPYTWEEVREAALSAMLAGVTLVGNQFNIISGRCYITRAGYQRKLAQLEGFSDFVSRVGVPKPTQGGYIVACSGEWKMAGVKQSLAVDIFVRADSFTTVDAAVGKAERKFFKRVFEQASGRVEAMPDGEVGEVAPVSRPPVFQVEQKPAETPPAIEVEAEPQDEPVKRLDAKLREANITEVALLDWLLARKTIPKRMDSIVELSDQLITAILDNWEKTAMLVKRWVEREGTQQADLIP